MRKGFVGGEPTNLWDDRPGVEIGVWFHPGTHPSEAKHIRYGRYDDGQWYVMSSDRPTGRWLFRRQEDAELAVVELQAARPGEWQVKVDPLSGGAVPESPGPA